MMAPGFFVPVNRSIRLSIYPWKTTLLCVVVVAPGAMAQSVLAPPPTPPPLAPSAVQEYQTNQPVQMQVFAPSQTAPSAEEENEPFKYGPVVIRPQINYQFLYGNGVQSAPGQPQNTIVQQFSPGIILNLGTHWTLNYTPTFNFYSSTNFQNTIDENVQLQWGTAYRDWFITASQSYAYSDAPQTETGSQSDQTTYATALDATYHFSDRLSTDLGANQNFNYYGNGNSQSSTSQLLAFANSRTWSTMDWLNDQLWPRLTASIGLGLGYNQQQGSSDFVDEEYEARLNWRVTDKLSLQVSGGLEDQEYLSGGAGDLLTPVFAGTIQYQPFQQTRISVNASRTISPSAYQDQQLESTTITGDFNQRLFGGLFLDLNGGYFLTSYSASATGLSTARNDNTYTFNARLSCPFPRRGTFSIFYQYSNNSSSQSGFAVGSSAYSYSSSQIGFQIGYNY
jgi:hypothetical protein